MDRDLLKFLLRANLLVGIVFLALTLLFTFGNAGEPSTVATASNWRGEACFLQSSFGSGLRSCWDLFKDGDVSGMRFLSTALLVLAQFCGLAAAALLLNAFTIRRMLRKK